MLVEQQQKKLSANNQINTYITEISREIKMDTLDFTLELCNLKLFAIQGSHLNSDGYEKLSKMINSDSEVEEIKAQRQDQQAQQAEMQQAMQEAKVAKDAAPMVQTLNEQTNQQ